MKTLRPELAARNTYGDVEARVSSGIINLARLESIICQIRNRPDHESHVVTKKINDIIGTCQGLSGKEVKKQKSQKAIWSGILH